MMMLICRDAQKISEHLLLLHGDGNYSIILIPTAQANPTIVFNANAARRNAAFQL
jgi:hypothetical protein